MTGRRDSSMSYLVSLLDLLVDDDERRIRATDMALLVDDPVFLEHRARGEHPERPERLLAARRAVARTRNLCGFVDLAARAALPSELRRVHTEDYLDRLGQVAGAWTMLDADTFVSPRSVEAAMFAAGAAVELVDALLDREERWGVALLRPPGHHARPSAAMGFCLLNNVAVAAAHARARGVERVLVLDWDVHHGNGTQEMFYADPSVLYVSLHQFPYYPATGAETEVGRGDGRGYTVNVPLSSGATDSVYAEAFRRIVAPIIDEYRPGLALVSAGFDAHIRDPLGGMALSEQAYGTLTSELRRALPTDTRIAMLLEGGYDLPALESGLTACFGALAGEALPTLSPSSFARDHERELERALAVQRHHWHLG
jgi:acetoin utilization deacetylase AcuC-like enzyme